MQVSPQTCRWSQRSWGFRTEKYSFETAVQGISSSDSNSSARLLLFSIIGWRCRKTSLEIVLCGRGFPLLNVCSAWKVPFTPHLPIYGGIGISGIQSYCRTVFKIGVSLHRDTVHSPNRHNQTEWAVLVVFTTAVRGRNSRQPNV